MWETSRVEGGETKNVLSLKIISPFFCPENVTCGE